MFAVVSINEVSGVEKSINFRLNHELSQSDSYEAVPCHMCQFLFTFKTEKNTSFKR